MLLLSTKTNNKIVPMWVRHSVLAGFTCHDLQNEEREREREREIDR